MDPNAPIPMIDGEEQEEERLFNIGTGKYDVTVKAGPSYASQREETREALIEIMRQVPGAGLYIGDLVMKYLDFEGSEEVEKRLQMALQAQGLNVSGQPPAMMPGGVPPQQPGSVPSGVPGSPLQQGGTPIMPPGTIPQ